MKSKFANLNLGEINVLSAEQKKGVTGGAYGSGGGSGPAGGCTHVHNAYPRAAWGAFGC
jgi:hypothetical protein